MALAHICLQCGTGLGRIRPNLDPHYGLPIVTCPNCDWNCVRRKAHASESWKNVQRRVWVYGLIVVKVVISLFLLGAMLGAIQSLYFGEFEVGRNVTPRAYLIMVVMLMIVLPVTIGTWLSFAFDHLPRWKVFAGWASLAVACLFLIAIIIGLTGEVAYVSHQEWQTISFATLAWTGMAEIMPSCLALLAIMMAVTLVGIPLGRVARSARGVLAGWHWRWMLKRRRLRRSME